MKPMKKMLRREKRREEISHLLDPKTAKRAAREMDNALIDLEEVSAARYAYAREIFLMQDEVTRNAITMMVEKMAYMAGDPVVKYKGILVQAELHRLQQIQMQNLNWSAIRLFVACAIWDIQIANFKLSEDTCAQCGTKI
jgi:hypothetical protein